MVARENQANHRLLVSEMVQARIGKSSHPMSSCDSGDDHDLCVVQHPTYAPESSTPVVETTVKAFVSRVDLSHIHSLVSDLLRPLPESPWLWVCGDLAITSSHCFHHWNPIHRLRQRTLRCLARYRINSASGCMSTSRLCRSCWLRCCCPRYIDEFSFTLEGVQDAANVD